MEFVHYPMDTVQDVNNNSSKEDLWHYLEMEKAYTPTNSGYLTVVFVKLPKMTDLKSINNL